MPELNPFASYALGHTAFGHWSNGGSVDDWVGVRRGWWIVFLILNEIARHTVTAAGMIAGIHALAWVIKVTSVASGVSVVDTPLATLPWVGVVHLKQLLLTIDAVFIVRFAYEAYRDIERIFNHAHT